MPLKPSQIAFSGSEENRIVGDIYGAAGPVVLLLHGGGQTRHAWQNTAKQVASKGMRAVAVDLRGHGESEWVASGRYGFDAFAADVAALSQQIEERFGVLPSIVGASLGGLSALLAESKFGPVCQRLVLVDVTPRMDVGGVAKVQQFMGARVMEGFGTLEEAADAIAAYLPHRQRPKSLAGLEKNLRKGADGRFRWHWDPAFIRGQHNINTGAANLLHGLMENLPAVPILLVRGGQSELVHEAHANEFVETAPNASYVDVTGAGHMVAGDRNDAFSRAVIDFLDR